MAFSSINKQFTLSAFTSYLAGLPRPSWGARASTFHNTYSPTEAQWQGKASMDSMQAYYVGKGWTAGPHCFLALHSPNAANDGIWVMTEPKQPGIHAGACNDDHFGIEVVGDFQSRQPSAAQQQLLIDTVAALHRWASCGPTLDAHRDCMADRTCPGDAFYALKPSLQQRLSAALGTDPLKARTLQGPNRLIYCSVEAYDFYHARGGFPHLGFPLRDEFYDSSKACYILQCERTVNKRSTQYGNEYALILEAVAEGWV